MRLGKMAFRLSGTVSALHLENSAAKAYLCSHNDTASTFLFRLACNILNLGDIHGINLHVDLPISIWKLAITGKVGSRVAPSSHSRGSILTLGSTRGGSGGIHTYHWVSALLPPWKSTTSGSLGIECFKHPRTFRWVMCFLLIHCFP